MGTDAVFVQEFSKLIRKVGTWRRGGPSRWIRIRRDIGDMAIHVRYHLAGNVPFALGRKPTDNVAFEPPLGKHFPDGLAFASGCRDRNDSPRLWLDFGEPWNTVVISHFAGGNRGPEHGRQLRLESRQVATGSGIDETLKGRHCARVHQGVDQFPIGRIPTDKEQSFFGHQWYVLKINDRTDQIQPAAPPRPLATRGMRRTRGTRSTVERVLH